MSEEAVPESRAEAEAKLIELGVSPEDWDTPAEWDAFVDFMCLLGMELNQRVEDWEKLPHEIWED